MLSQVPGSPAMHGAKSEQRAINGTCEGGGSDGGGDAGVHSGGGDGGGDGSGDADGEAGEEQAGEEGWRGRLATKAVLRKAWRGRGGEEGW